MLGGTVKSAGAAVRLIPILPFAHSDQFLQLNGTALAQDRLPVERVIAECLLARESGARILFPENAMDHPEWGKIIATLSRRSLEWGIQIYPDKLEFIRDLQPARIELVSNRPLSEREKQLCDELRAGGVRIDLLWAPSRLSDPSKLMNASAGEANWIYFPLKRRGTDPYLGADEIAHWVGLYLRKCRRPLPDVACHWLETEPKTSAESAVSRRFRETLDLGFYWKNFESFGGASSLRRILRLMAFALARLKWWRR